MNHNKNLEAWAPVSYTIKPDEEALLDGFLKTVCEGGTVLALIQSELWHACLDVCLGGQVIETILVTLCNVFL